jgi:hypothetical protein
MKIAALWRGMGQSGKGCLSGYSRRYLGILALQLLSVMVGDSGAICGQFFEF